MSSLAPIMSWTGVKMEKHEAASYFEMMQEARELFTQKNMDDA